MDTYQAIYDATRSRISNGDIGQAVESAIGSVNLGHYFQMAAATIQEAASEHMNPSMLFRPRIFRDGNQWCALYGDNLQDGVAGFGDSPAIAMEDFDRNWRAKIADNRQEIFPGTKECLEGISAQKS